MCLQHSARKKVPQHWYPVWLPGRCFFLSLILEITHSLLLHTSFFFSQPTSTKSVTYCLTFHLLFIWQIYFPFVPQSLKAETPLTPLCPENDPPGIISNYLPAKSNEQILVFVVFDLEPLTLIIPSFLVSHRLVLQTHSSRWPRWSELPLHRIPFLCLSSDVGVSQGSVLCSLCTTNPFRWLYPHQWHHPNACWLSNICPISSNTSWVPTTY